MLFEEKNRLYAVTLKFSCSVMEKRHIENQNLHTFKIFPINIHFNTPLEIFKNAAVVFISVK